MQGGIGHPRNTRKRCWDFPPCIHHSFFPPRKMNPPTNHWDLLWEAQLGFPGKAASRWTVRICPSPCKHHASRGWGDPWCQQSGERGPERPAIGDYGGGGRGSGTREGVSGASHRCGPARAQRRARALHITIPPPWELPGSPERGTGVGDRFCVAVGTLWGRGGFIPLPGQPFLGGASWQSKQACTVVGHGADPRNRPTSP